MQRITDRMDWKDRERLLGKGIQTVDWLLGGKSRDEQGWIGRKRDAFKVRLNLLNYVD